MLPMRELFRQEQSKQKNGAHRSDDARNRAPNLNGADMDEQKVFIGRSDSCDFESNTWAFAMNDSFKVGSGEYAIMRLADYKLITGETPEIKPNTTKPTICHKHG